MRLLYLDCFSGIAGDMLLGALLDAGADRAFVDSQLAALDISGWKLGTRPVTRAGVRATQATVTIEDDGSTRDHSEIQAILERSLLDERVRGLAQQVFERLARAEAAVHGVELAHVHLHEVGALDAFVDIVGCSAALLSLGPLDVMASALPVGGGRTRSAHGELPVPPPAVLELLKGIPIRGGGERELVTPTGAALVTTFARSFGDLPPMTVRGVGYGAGQAERDVPNVVRALIGDAAEPTPGASEALLLEANIDDMNPELVPYAIEQLLAAGAYDAWSTPIVMKKGRPAITLSVLGPHDELDRLLDVFYAETTTLGVRLRMVGKDELEREWLEVEVEGHNLRVKIGKRNGRIVTTAPEYEDAKTVARATGQPLKEVYTAAVVAARDRLKV
jgi:pyridinium-3,5-bisthiocarboxylic acid mononucleotide nickel chelatase